MFSFYYHSRERIAKLTQKPTECDDIKPRVGGGLSVDRANNDLPAPAVFVMWVQRCWLVAASCDGWWLTADDDEMSGWRVVHLT